MRNLITSALQRIAPTIYRAFPRVRTARYAVQRYLVLKGILDGPHLRLDIDAVPPILSPLELDDAARAIAFEPAAKPRVSIIIPVYNKVEYTLTCLRSLACHATRWPYEAIVVDDCSTDRTGELLSAIPNLTVIRNQTNLGFLNNCNLAAAEARGELLVFLNNDTNLLPHWLDALVDTFDTVEGAGIVGSKLVYADGSLQEAGGIIWEDGSGANYGRGGDPEDPRFNYMRDVDYVSGASLLIETELFRALGGFDARYSPAYYEDTDLCFRVREDAGRRVLYQPRSALIHYEGISSGTDLTAGVKRHQAVNQPIFRERWARVLGRYGAPQVPSISTADRRPDRHILVLDHRTPTPDQDSGSIDMYNILEILTVHFGRVHFVPLYEPDYNPKYTPPLEAMGIECSHYPFYKNFRQFVGERAHLLTHVLISRKPVAQDTIDFIREVLPHARIIFQTVDLHFLREQRQQPFEGHPVASDKLDASEAEELALMRKADATIVISPHEAEILQSKNVGEVHILPLIRKFEEPRPVPFAQRNGIVFFGGFEHYPNVDAAEYLVEAIWPKVREVRSARGLNPIPLVIAGSKMPDELKSLCTEEISAVGYVASPSDLFEKMRFSIAPLRFGAGLKGKVLSSIAEGVPVIGTRTAFEGFPAMRSGEAPPFFLEGDSADELARLVVETYDRPGRWQDLSAKGLRYAHDHFSIDTARLKLGGILGLG